MSRLFKVALVSALFVLSVSNHALGEELDLLDLGIEELLQVEVVSGASRYEQTSSKAPSAVTVVTRKQIQSFGYRSFAELINGVRGFYSTNDRNYNYTGVRGFGRPADFDSRLLVLLNGHRLNDSIYSSALLGLDFMIDIDLVEQVEIIRGPSSSVYGTNAVFGVINVVTRTPDDVGAEVSSDLARFDTYQGRASYGKKYENGLEVLLSATRFDSGGEPDVFFPEFDSLDTSNGSAENLDREDGVSSFLSLSYEDLKLEAGFVDRRKDNPAAPFETLFNDPEFRTRDERFFTNLTHSYQFSEDLRLETRAYYDWYQYTGFYPYDYAEEEDEAPFLVTNKDTARGERLGLLPQIVSTGIENHKIVFGGEYREIFNLDQQNFDVDPSFSYLNSYENDRVWALFVQDEVLLSDWATLTAGLRFDDYEISVNEWSPRLGLILNPSEDSTVKLLYGRAFRAPNAFELFYEVAISQKQAESLDPEVITTYEVVYEQVLSDNFRMILDAYYYEIEDLIDQTIDPADDFIVYRNLNEAEAYGFEAELEARFEGGWYAKTSYAFQHAEDSETNQDLSNSPRHLWKNHVVAPLFSEKLKFASELLYTSSRDNVFGNKISPYWLANFTLLYEDLLDGLNVSASIFNAFDRGFGDPGSNEHIQDEIPGRDLDWRIQLTYRFGRN